MQSKEKQQRLLTTLFLTLFLNTYLLSGYVQPNIIKSQISSGTVSSCELHYYDNTKSIHS